MPPDLLSGPVASSLLTDRRPHGSQNAHEQKKHETEQLLTQDVVAKSGGPGRHDARGIVLSGLYATPSGLIQLGDAVRFSGLF
jgi:hypothetical protein